MERHRGKTVSGGSMIEKNPKREGTYIINSQGKLSNHKNADYRGVSSLHGQPNRAFLLRTLACRNQHHITHVDKAFVPSRPGRMPPTIYTTSPYGHTGRPEAFEANLRPKSSARFHTELEQSQQALLLSPSRSAPPIATPDQSLLQVPKPQYLASERTEKEAQTSPKSESAQKGNTGKTDVENINKVTVNDCADGYKGNSDAFPGDIGELRLFDSTMLNEKKPVPYIGSAVEDDKPFTGTFSSYVRQVKDPDNDRNKRELSLKTMAVSKNAYDDKIPSRVGVRWANEQKTAIGKCDKVPPKADDFTGFRGDRCEVNAGLCRSRGRVNAYSRDPLRKILKPHDFPGSNEIRCRSTKTKQSDLIQRFIRCITGKKTRDRNPIETSQSSSEPTSQKEWQPGSLSQTTDTDCDSNQNKTDETDNTVRDTLETFNRVRVPADNKRDHNVIRARFYSNQKQINAIKTRLVTLSRQQLTGAKNAKEEFCQIHESLTALANKIELMSTALAEQNTMVQELNKVVQDLPSKITPITRHPSCITRPQYGTRKPSSDQYSGARTKNYSGIQVRSRSVARCDQINAASLGERREKHPSFMRRSSSTNVTTLSKVFRLAEEPDASRRTERENNPCSVTKHEDDKLMFGAATRRSSDVSSPTNGDLPRPVSQVGRQSCASRLLKKIKSPGKFTPNEQDSNHKRQPSRPVSEVEESVFDINPTDLVSSSPSSRCSSPPTLPTMIEGPNSRSINEPSHGLQRYYRIAYVDSECATQSRVGHKLAATAPTEYTGSRSVEFDASRIESPDAPKVTEVLNPGNFVKPNHAKEAISNLQKEQSVKERLTVDPESRYKYSGRSVCRKSHNGNASGDAYSLRKKKVLNQGTTNSHNGIPHAIVGGSGDASTENTRYQHRSNLTTTTRKLSPVPNIRSTTVSNSKRVWRSDSTVKLSCSSISEQSNLPETQIQRTQLGTQHIYPSANSSGYFGFRFSKYENHNVGFSKKSPANAAGKTAHRWPSHIRDSNNNCAESNRLGSTYLTDGTSSKCTNNSQKSVRQKLDTDRGKQADTFHFLMAPFPDHFKAAQPSACQTKPTVYALPEPDDLPTTSYTTQKLQAGRDARRTEAEKKWCEELRKLGVRKSGHETEAPAREIPSSVGDQKFQYGSAELDESSDTKDIGTAKEETCKVTTMTVDYKERRRKRLEAKVQEDLKAILAMTEQAVAERKTRSFKTGVQEVKRDEKTIESSSIIETTASREEVSTSDQPTSVSASTAGTVTLNGEDKANEVDAFKFMSSSKLEEKTAKRELPSVSVNIKENSSEDIVPPSIYPFVQPCNTALYPFSDYIPLSPTVSMSSKALCGAHHHCVPFTCASSCCCCFNQINPVFYPPSQHCWCDGIKVQPTCEKRGARSLLRRQRSPYSCSSSSENGESSESSCSSSETSVGTSSSSTSSSSYSRSATPKLRRPSASYLLHPTHMTEDSTTVYQTAQNSHQTSPYHLESTLFNPVTVYGENGCVCPHGSYAQSVFAHPVTQGVSIIQQCNQRNAWTTHGRTTLFRRCNVSTMYPHRCPHLTAMQVCNEKI